MTDDPWLFDASPGTAVVTTSYVTKDRMPVLYVTHEHDDEGGTAWQFHCGNGYYSPSVLQLVSLGEILCLDPSVGQLAGLPAGFCARRATVDEPWITYQEN